MAKKKPDKQPRPRMEKAKKAKPKPESRLFEELIARIEAVAAPLGATVKPNDHIPDKKTGELRQVDASIRYQLGTVPILITVECRKRVKVDDATWIEQLRTKKEDIGAHHTIAVSVRGFSEPARIKAESYGIDVRQYEEITSEEIGHWSKGIQITSFQVDFNITGAYIQFNPPRPGLLIAAHLREAIAKDALDTPFVFNKADGAGFTLRNLLAMYEQAHGPIDEDIELGDSKTAQIRRNCKPGSVYSRTEEGELDVDFIVIAVDATYRQVARPLDKVSRYRAENKVFSHVAECLVPGEGGAKIEMIIPSGSPFEPPQVKDSGDRKAD
jgi:hypothetical protein